METHCTFVYGGFGDVTPSRSVDMFVVVALCDSAVASVVAQVLSEVGIVCDVAQVNASL